MKAIGGLHKTERELQSATLHGSSCDHAHELDFAKSVEVFIDQKIPRRKLEDFAYIYTALLDDSPPKPVRRKTGGGPKKKRR